MLIRIQQLRNIGRFRNATCGAVSFKQITIVFGRNTYGKTTLTDLISSMAINDLGKVIPRKSIPRDNNPQEASVSFLCPGDSTETPISIESSYWQPSLPGGLNLAVFDDSFYSKNIFAAGQFTRSTKENFSAFVLGEQGVAKATTIAEKNREKRAATYARNQLTQHTFGQIQDLESFINLEPNKGIEEAESRIDEFRRQIDSLTDQQNNSEVIKNRSQCQKLEWNFDSPGAVATFNVILQSSLETYHEEAREKVAQHIANHFTDSTGAETWIRTGLAQNNGATCQFCSQPLSGEAKELLKLYQQSFDSSFERHAATIEGQLSISQSLFRQDHCNPARVTIEENNAAILSYPEITNNGEFTNLRQNMLDTSRNIQAGLLAWEQVQPEFLNQFEQSVANKKDTPHRDIGAIQDSQLEDIYMNVASLCGEYNSAVNAINTLFQSFKNSVDTISLTERIQELEVHRTDATRVKQRIELSDQVREYVSYENDISRLNEEIPQLEAELRADQSNYLDRFFEQVNRWFYEFGSNDFVLEMGDDRSGHTPVYFLSVKYRDQTISENELDRVFSVSDRRALALAVFWASLTNLSEAELGNTIVVLDDPVTSFDNNRITAVHQETARISDYVRQVIILSHYDTEVSKFLSKYKNSKDIALVEIKMSHAGSTLESADIDHFVMDEHARKTNDIRNFISRHTDMHNSGDLRIYFEYEIDLRFANQILDLNLSNATLGDKIIGLKENNIISDDVATKAEDWKNTLNPEHHTWTESDIEDQRLTANRFMSFIYTELVPT